MANITWLEDNRLQIAPPKKTKNAPELVSLQFSV